MSLRSSGSGKMKSCWYEIAASSRELGPIITAVVLVGNFLILLFNTYKVEKDSKWSQKNRKYFSSQTSFCCTTWQWNTLTHRARALCSTPQLLNNELQHLEKVLKQCKYLRQAINKVLQKQQHQQMNTANNRHIHSSTKKKCYIVVPCAEGTCESFKTIWQKFRVQLHFKGGTTLKNLLVSPEDKDTITK